MSAVNQQPLSNELHFCSLHELNEYLASLQRNPDILKRLNRNLTIIFRFYLGLTPSIQSNHTFHKICEDFCAMIPSLLEHPEIQVKTLVFDGHMPQDSEIRNRILQTIERKLDGTMLSLNFQRCVLDSAEALTDWLQVLHTKLRTLTVFHMTRGPLFGMMQTPNVSSLTELELRLPDNAEWQLYFALISHAPHLRTLRLSADFIQDEGVIRRSNLFDDLKLFDCKYLDLLHLEIRIDPSYLHWVVPVIHSACVATRTGALKPHPTLKRLELSWFEPAGRDEYHYFPEPEWASIVYHLSTLMPPDGTGVRQMILTRVPGQGAMPFNRAEGAIRRRLGLEINQSLVRVQDGMWMVV